MREEGYRSISSFFFSIIIRVLLMKKAFMDVSKILEKEKFKIDEKKYRGYQVNHFCVDYKSEKYVKRVRGDYFTITFDYVSLHQKQKMIKRELMKILKLLFKDLKTADPLIIGLGNSSILCDSLGVKTTNKVMATNHFTDFLNIPKVALFNPEVTEKTGISSFSLIEMVVRKLKPSMIIMIDSLATNNKELLNYSIEVNNTGIIPGSAIKDNKKIDKNTFGIPVIAIGVPLVLELDKKMYTTPNVEEIINLTSTIIADALNDLFF